MGGTDWRAFGIGMVAGAALMVCVYFGWMLLRPNPSATANAAASENIPLALDENALVAANAERPGNSLRPPPRLEPEPGPVEIMPAPVRPAPVRPAEPVRVDKPVVDEPPADEPDGEPVDE
jgi:hypothetical protein